MEKIKKLCSRFANSFVGVFLLAIILMEVGRELGSRIYNVLNAQTIIEPDIWQTMHIYTLFIGIWIVVIGYMFITKKNRPILKALGTRPMGNNLLGLGIGLLIGFGMNLFCAAVAMANNDISISFSRFDLGGLLIVFIVVFIQSSAEELICRVFVYQRFMRRYKNPVAASVLNASLFAILHLANPGITWRSFAVIMLSGLLFSAMVFYMDSSWAPMGAHAAWNYTQNILLGLPNSSLVVPFSLFKVDAVSDSWAYDVTFGLEGSITAVFIQLVVLAVIIVWGRKHRKPPYDVWADENSNSVA